MEIQNFVVGDKVRWVPNNGLGCKLHEPFNGSPVSLYVRELDIRMGSTLYEIVEIPHLYTVYLKEASQIGGFHDEDEFGDGLPVCIFHLRRAENEVFNS